MEFTTGGETIRINVPTWATLEARVTERLARKHGFALATLNLDHLVKLRNSAEFRRAYARQDFVTADGWPIVWMSQIARRQVSLIPGADAIIPLCRIAAQQGAPIALVGSTPAVLQSVKSLLEREVRELRVVDYVAPPMGFDPEGEAAVEILHRLQEKGARLVFVALGAPKQEIFAAFARDRLPEAGFASIGAGLDFIAGSQNRAPVMMRRSGLEWFWRAMSNPRRLIPRYVRCAAILPGQIVRSLLLRMRNPVG